MKLLGISALLAIILFAGGAMQFQKLNQGNQMNSVDSTNKIIVQKLLEIPTASIHEADCKILHAGFSIEGSRCFLSVLEADKVLPLIKSSFDGFASTPGWEQNYGVYSGFYILKSNSQYSFGINVKDIEGDRDFEGIEQVKGYKSYISMVVEPNAH